MEESERAARATGGSPPPLHLLKRRMARGARGVNPRIAREARGQYTTSAVYFKEGIYKRTGMALARRQEQSGWRWLHRAQEGRREYFQCLGQWATFTNFYDSAGGWMERCNRFDSSKPRPKQWREQLEEALASSV